MGKITGGEFRYLRRVKTGDYEHKEVDVKMSWSADDADTPLENVALADAAEKDVIARVGRMLHAPLKAGASREPEARAPAGAETAVTAEPSQQAPAQPVQTRGRGRPPGSANKPRVEGQVIATDPLDMPGETITASLNPGPLTTTTDPAAIDLMEAEEVVTITDLVLQDKITRKNGNMIEKGVTEAPRRIKKLIAIYAGGAAPKTARDIPVEKRAAFLLELDKAESVVLP